MRSQHFIFIFCASLFELCCFAVPYLAAEQKIYVMKEKDGSLLFSSRPPRDGRSAEVFSSKGARYSYTQRRGFGGRLFTQTYRAEIVHASQKYGVDAALIQAVIHAESAFNPQAVSPKGAVGLMQIMPSNFKQLALTKPFEPKDNISAGTRFLAQLIEQYEGNLSLGLAAYNAGPGAVAKFGGIPPFRETREYVQRVLHFYGRYQKSA